MPKFQVVKSKYLAEQVANLKQALQEKLSDGKPHVVRFFSKLPESENAERFIVDAELGK